jgi:Asp/Glu/hydantoin racemase
MILRSVLRASLLISIAATYLLRADVTYTKSLKYTGGTMLDALRSMAANPVIGRMAGASLGSALHDQNFTVYLKGSKMAQIGDPLSVIFDLDAGTVTTLNNENQTYSVQTFEEMRLHLEQAQQRMKRSKAGDVQFDVKVENTGRTQTLNGQAASETIMTLSAQSDGPYGHPIVRVNAWLVPIDSTTREVHEFSKRSAEKMSSTFSSMPAIFGGAGTALSTATTELQKMDGIPVLDDVTVTGLTTPLNLAGRNTDPNAPVIAIETQSSNFASGPVDDSRFNVPAGYSLEQHRR